MVLNNGFCSLFMYEPDTLAREAAERYFRTFDFRIDRSKERRGLIPIAKGSVARFHPDLIKIDTFQAASTPTGDMVEMLEAMPTAVVVDATSARFVCERMRALEFTSVPVLVTYGSGSDGCEIADKLLQEGLAHASIAKPLQLEKLVGIVVSQEILANV